MPFTRGLGDHIDIFVEDDVASLSASLLGDHTPDFLVFRSGHIELIRLGAKALCGIGCEVEFLSKPKSTSAKCHRHNNSSSSTFSSTFLHRKLES
jgi:hypothetical protein